MKPQALALSVLVLGSVAAFSFITASGSLCALAPTLSSVPRTQAIGSSATVPTCLNILHHLPKPLMFTDTKAHDPFQLVVADPSVDTLISKFVVDSGLWDVHVLKALELVGRDACRRGELAMDVGANLGFFTNALLAMGCEVTSFEMQTEMAQRLKFSACANGALDRLNLHVGAVSDERGELHRVAGQGNLGGVGITEDEGGIPVQAWRIDEVMSLDKAVSVMKMDVEGHEDRALSGMDMMFEKRLVRNIVLEFTPDVMGVERAAKMLEKLYSYGFTNIVQLDFMSPEEYDRKAKVQKVDTSLSSWAKVYSKKIADGGDSRGIKFTDLLLSLS